MIDSRPLAEPAYQLSMQEWLEKVDDHYLRGYIRDGGATVKVVVADDATRRRVLSAVLDQAQGAGFVTASVDAQTCRLHMVQNLFTQVAQNVDWSGLADQFVRRGLASRGFTAHDGPLDLQGIASQHGIAYGLMHQQLLQLLTSSLIQSRELAREMRLATVQLCLAAAERTDQATQMGQNVEDWLCGRLRLISALKQALIHQKVNRHNARGLLASLGAWARMSGRSGLVVVVDIARYLDPAADPAEGLRFTKGATLEAYEVLRQFIDGTDEMVGTMLVFLTGPAFQTDAHRGMRAYDALRLRLYDDVRDRSRPNPLSPMVALVGPHA